ncbi:TOMM precursor leader peptide-binding protein [Streptomyces sp. NPDC048305]|uniref:TOMM precursor leader peptide-binding protein n=1 Tax=Streptomyces sp. NPDC048305 TaxID=3365532 RepID=UPI003720445C
MTTSSVLEGMPLEYARQHLQKALAEHFGPSETPIVSAMGARDVPGSAAGSTDISMRSRSTVHLTARDILVGPWGGDRSGLGCGVCLAMRWQRLRSRSEREALETGEPWSFAPLEPQHPVFVIDAVIALCDSVLASHALPRTGGTSADRALPQVSCLDTTTLQVRTFPLYPDPLCPHCGPGGTDTREASELRLLSRSKPDVDTYRLKPASSFPLAPAALANPVTGMLGAGTWMNITSPTTAPVAGSVFMRGYAGLTDVTWSGQANSFDTSRSLAFLEGIERYAGTHRRRGTALLTARYRDIAQDALDPAACGFYSSATYRDDPMVSPFDPDRPIPWVWGHSLRDERPVLVPARLVHYSAGLAADNFVFECSNGCAIGSCLEEAVLGALLELIERDAFLLGWYGGTPLTEIDLNTVTEPTTRAMIDRANLLGYDVHAFDNRIDLAVPVVTGLAVRQDGGTGMFSFGASSSMNAAAALEGALSEVLTYIPHLPGQVEERRHELQAMAADFSKVLHLKDHAQLYGLPETAPFVAPYRKPRAIRPMADIYAPWESVRPVTRDLVDDVRFCRDELVGAGHDVIVVDQTTPEQQHMGLRTVCALVPGLLPIDFGWSRQRALTMPRLRTAARRAGLRDSDLTASEIRQIPHPFP